MKIPKIEFETVFNVCRGVASICILALAVNQFVDMSNNITRLNQEIEYLKLRRQPIIEHQTAMCYLDDRISKLESRINELEDSSDDSENDVEQINEVFLVDEHGNRKSIGQYKQNPESNVWEFLSNPNPNENIILCSKPC